MSYFYEKATGRLVKQLACFPYYGMAKVLNLLEYQDSHEQFIISEEHLQEYFLLQKSKMTTEEKLQLYFSLFKGRNDVYAKSYIDDKGKIQYYPSYHYGWRKLPPEKRTCEPLTEDILKRHLRGDSSIGMFPISKSDTCAFLVIDFDEADWRESVLVLRKVAEKKGLNVYVEISRSGNGAHAWFFFKEEISCQQARNFGKNLLELAMQESQSVSFASLDRMFPNQDFLPKGGFGNLIALPLQGKAYAEGRTVFVDESFQPYIDQWEHLQSIQKIPYNQLEKVLSATITNQQDDNCLELTLSNILSVEKSRISAKTSHFLKTLASFSNPEFYLKQATRQPTYQTPERIYLFEETDNDIRLPRGLLSKLEEYFEQITIIDNRYYHDPINVVFTGQLRFEQELALADIVRKENGLLCAETGFGKTILGAALVAHRRKKTIILVHNRQLLEQWLDKLSAFLTFKEEEAVRYTPSGRKKKIGHIGQYAGSKKWRSELVDVVMIQSLFQLDNISTFLSGYDMMIVGECHHVTAVQFEKVISQFSGKYLYGLTATPERKNGHEPIIFQRIGDILHTAEIDQVTFDKILVLRFTPFGKLDIEKSNSTSFSKLNEWIAKETIRNQMICQDICNLYESKRKILVLVNRIEHLETLKQLLIQKGLSSNIFLLSGKIKRKSAKEIREKMEALGDDSPLVLISTGKYIGEGFDLPKLDTLILAAPLSWKNNLIQYAGRIHRPYQGKNEVEIIDYIDIHVPYLEKMYQKRQVAYRKMSYQLKEKDQKQTLFGSKTYESTFIEDIQKSYSTIFIRTASITTDRICYLLSLLGDKQIELQIPIKHKLSSWLNGLEKDNLKVTLLTEKISTNAIIIDASIVWYGNLSPLGYQFDETMSLLRLESTDIAKELLDKYNSI
ncbi:DEAD/DEAH box helicase family protein [Streptococcus sp. H31]|uniref:TOTE conflict system archaeo-eukaryotic primase domain-containing protein n=1 Tax=Streptococcus huangxiaojuni TaxID=3237239 RepID=UPI0034A2B985